MNWRKSSRSDTQPRQCVEAAPLGGAVAVRDSTHPNGPRLRVSARSWSEFARTIKLAGLSFGLSSGRYKGYQQGPRRPYEQGR